MMSAYPASLNQVSFFGRNLTARNATLSQGKGPQWQRDAAVQTELKLQCVSQFFSDMHAAQGNLANWHYRYNVLDETKGGLADQGLFTPHTAELYAIWGRNSTDGGDPKCFSLSASETLSCANAIAVVSAYWISFVRTLDPNTFRSQGTPSWEPWSIGTPQRMVFNNADAGMETVGAEGATAGMAQRERCVKLVLPLSKAINQNLGKGQTLLPFANGTAVDLTVQAVRGGGGNGTAGNGTSGSDGWDSTATTDAGAQATSTSDSDSGQAASTSTSSAQSGNWNGYGNLTTKGSGTATGNTPATITGSNAASYPHGEIHSSILVSVMGALFVVSVVL